MSKLLKERWNRLAFGKGTQTLNESDEWYGKMPEDLWELSDWEDARDAHGSGEEFDAYFQSQTTEHLEMKIEQLEAEIEYEMSAMTDMQNQYDMAVAGKESLLYYIRDEVLEARRRGE